LPPVLIAATLSLPITAAAQTPEPSLSPLPQPAARPYAVQLRHGVPKDDNHSSRPINHSPISPGPAGAHLTYYGGPVVSSVKVVVVYYGSGSYLPQLSTGLP